MRKILIITSLYPNTENPIRGIFVQKQANLLKKNNQVKIFATEISSINSSTFYWQDAIEVHQIKYNFPKFILSPCYYLKAVRKNLKKLLNDYVPDVIHIHDYKHIPELLILSRLIDFRRYKVVVTLHNNKQITEHQGLRTIFYNYTLKKILKKYSKIIVVSNKVKKMISPFYTNSDKINIIGNGVEFDFPQLSKTQLKDYLPDFDSSFQIISIGNLVHTKGFDLLILAVSELNAQGLNVNLTIIGDGNEKINLSKMIDSYNISDKIRLLGQVNHDIVMNVYKYYDAFVLPSWSETFGIVYLEAMLAKIPVIGVKGEGIDGIIIDNENGFLVKPKDLDSLVRTIKQLMENNQIEVIVNNAFKEVQKHKLANIINEIERSYE